MVWLAWVLGAGCGALIGIEEPLRLIDGGVGPADAAITASDGPPGVDAAHAPDARPADAAARPDGPPEPDAGSCVSGWRYDPVRFDPCTLPASNGPLVVTAAQEAVLDTSTGQITREGITSTLISDMRAQAGASMYRLVRFDSLGIAGKLKVVGEPALVIAVDGAFTIQNGVLDVSARMLPDGSSQAGPGGNDPVACPLRTEMIGHNIGGLDEGAGGGGGGGGGSSGATGGRGGNHAAAGGGSAGPAAGNASLVPLHGGCPGGAGGNAALPGGFGGAGGGALRISADTIGITQDAFIMANGAGGMAGFFAPQAPAPSGGGGGGAGGAILLEGYSMVALGTNGTHPSICANGGGGGEGSYPIHGGHGAPGTCSGTAAGAGGTGATSGGDGGAGGYAGMVMGQNGFPGANGASPGGGGGGGGAVGRIRVLEYFSPPPFLGNSDVSPEPVFE